MVCLERPFQNSPMTNLSCSELTRRKAAAKTAAVSALCTTSSSSSSSCNHASSPCSVRRPERRQATRDGCRVGQQATGAGRARQQHPAAPRGATQGRQRECHRSYYSAFAPHRPTHFLHCRSARRLKWDPFPSPVPSGRLVAHLLHKQRRSRSRGRRVCGVSVAPPPPPCGLQHHFIAVQVWTPCSCPPPPEPGACPLMLH